MRSIFLFLCTIACIGKTLSQNRFYLRPAAEAKAYMSHSDAGHLIRTPYYEYRINRIGLLGGLELGLMAGYRFNKNKTLIETGIRTENSESGWNLFFLDYAVDPRNSNNAYSYTSYCGTAGGSVGKKIPIIFSTQLKQWNIHLYRPTSFSLYCNLVTGINYFYQHTGVVPFNFGGKTTMLSPTVLMDAQPTTYALRSHAILYEAGLSFDLRKRQREWFTLTLYYMRGFNNLSVEMLDITLTDTGTNAVEKYHYNSYGQGTALLLEISKKIFFSKAKRE
jgi:hypothetical protein